MVARWFESCQTGNGGINYYLPVGCICLSYLSVTPTRRCTFCMSRAPLWALTTWIPGALAKISWKGKVGENPKYVKGSSNNLI